MWRVLLTFSLKYLKQYLSWLFSFWLLQNGIAIDSFLYTAGTNYAMLASFSIFIPFPATTNSECLFQNVRSRISFQFSKGLLETQTVLTRSPLSGWTMITNWSALGYVVPITERGSVKYWGADNLVPTSGCHKVILGLVVRTCVQMCLLIWCGIYGKNG